MIGVMEAKILSDMEYVLIAQEYEEQIRAILGI